MHEVLVELGLDNPLMRGIVRVVTGLCDVCIIHSDSLPD